MGIQQRVFELMTEVWECWGLNKARARDILSPGDESEGKGQARIGLGSAFGTNVSLSCSARHSELKE